MAITRLSGGTTPANGSDPRTFPTIWNDAADDIEAAESAISTLQSDLTNLEVDDLADVTITTPADGEVLTYDDGTSEWVNQALPASGKILQVVQTVFDTPFTSTTNSEFTELFTASITPTSNTSKVLVLATIPADYGDAGNTDRVAGLTIFRGSTNLSVPDPAGAKTADVMASVGESRSGNRIETITLVFLDSPNTTSSTTYGVRFFNNSGTGFLTVNRSRDDGAFRAVSTITVMEVAG